MFGNLKGWLLSAVMLVVTAGLIVYAGRPDARSAPTGQLDIALNLAKLDVDPATVVPPGAKDQDAGDLYRALHDRVRAREISHYDKFRDAPPARKREVARQLLEPDLDLLAEAGESVRMTLMKPEEAVVYGNKPYLARLKRLGETAVDVGRLYMSPRTVAATATTNTAQKLPPTDPAKGRRYVEAAFRLGRFLYAERVTFREYDTGLHLMQLAAYTLSRDFVGLPAEERARYEAFRQALDAAARPQREAYQALAHPNVTAYPGDVFRVAADSKDPMWRTEAALKLGRMRLSAGVRFGDQRDAGVVLDQMAAEPDLPANVKAAVERARKLDAVGNQDIDQGQ